MAIVSIHTRTIIENVVEVEEEDIAGMTAQEIIDLMNAEPEVFGRDDDPHIEPDILVEINHGEDDQTLFMIDFTHTDKVLIPE